MSLINSKKDEVYIILSRLVNLITCGINFWDNPWFDILVENIKKVIYIYIKIFQTIEVYFIHYYCCYIAGLINVLF